MDKVLRFLTDNRISCLTTLLKDGSPHASTLHYSNKDNPLELYFSTENTGRKCEALLDGKPTKSSIVIGFSEEEWITLQMDGDVKTVLDKSELKGAQEIHYAKHPGSEKYKDDSVTIFLKFTPTWWRYTDYNTTPYTILSSD